MRRSRTTDGTRRPEAERAFLAGLLELVTDDPARCREAAALVEPAALTIEAGPGLLAAIQVAAALEAPTLADVLRLARERAGDDADDERMLVADLSKASASNRGGYARGVDRHAREVMKAAGRRRMIEAAQAAEAAAADPAAGPAEIEAAAAAVAASVATPADRLEWEPFPLSLLPDPVGTFVIEAAERLSTDPVFVALPMLASVAATIGNSRRIELWSGWREPPILWLATVADSGTMKTPSMDAALQFIRQRQDDAFREYRAAAADYEREKREHDRASRRRDAEPAEPPARPVAERFVVDDVTIEGLGPILEQNPRGVFLARDELSGWLEGFDRYSGGRGGGGEAGRWLSLYNASPLTVDRKLTGTLYVPSAAVSIYGGIQPKTLARALGERHVDNGLAQRFMLASPPRRMKAIPAGDMNFATIEAVRVMFATLGAIRPAEDGSPVVIDLDPEAAAAWRAFYNEHAREQHVARGHIASMLNKAEAWAARLALVLHLIALAGSDPGRGARIRADSIEAGVGIARWAAREWCRVFDLIQRGSIEADDRALHEWLRGRGGVATAREVARHGPRAYRAPGAAEAALQRLAKTGAAEWAQVETGGRPADAVRLR